MKHRSSPDREPRAPLEVATPGCGCSRCTRLKDMSRSGPPDATKQMGRSQHSATELGWRDGGSDHQDEGMFGHLRGAERADRAEREAYGKPLPAAYKYIIGPTPQTAFGDKNVAKLYLAKIETAIATGGWTRSEWARLYQLRDKWRNRATGDDPRYNEIGNRSVGLNRQQTANIKLKRIISSMKQSLTTDDRNRGD